MSKLGLKLVQMSVPAWNQGVKQTYQMTPQYITIHNTANRASARAEISYMIGNTDWTSYHWAVDDVEAIQAIPHNRNAWHCGDGGGAGNMSSIGIEICYSLDAGDPRYPKAEDNGAKLTAIILHELGWGIDRIRKHQDWSGKYCPHRILDNRNWEGFKSKVQTYLNQLKGGTTTTTQNKTTQGEPKDMYFTYQVSGDKQISKDTVFYYNAGINTIVALTHPDQLKIIRQIYKDTHGKDMPHYNWSASAPWYMRFIQATRAEQKNAL